MSMPLTGRYGAAAAFVAVVLVLVGCGRFADPEPSPAASSSAAIHSSTPVTKSTVPDREPHTLVLKATGAAKVTSIKYTLDRKLKKKGSVKLPWRQSVKVAADGKPHSWTLDVGFTGSGRVNLVAIFDGQVVAQGGSAGSGSGTTGDASVGGTVHG